MLGTAGGMGNLFLHLHLRSSPVKCTMAGRHERERRAEVIALRGPRHLSLEHQSYSNGEQEEERKGRLRQQGWPTCLTKSKRQTRPVTLVAAETLHVISRSFYASRQLVIIVYLSYEEREAGVRWCKTPIAFLVQVCQPRNSK